MSAAAESYTLKCKCGAFEATLTGPPKIVFNCQCHSCVAVIKAIEDRDGFSGTSIKSTNEGGSDSGDNNDYKGAAVAIYKSNNTTIDKVDESKVGFMKVGENGKLARPYCTECGTVLFNAFLPNWCAANRNAMTKSGTTEEGFTPSSPVCNVNCKHAFVPGDIPSPKHSTVPFGMLFKFIPLLTGFRCDGSHTNDKALVPEDMSKVEACPITWE